MQWGLACRNALPHVVTNLKLACRRFLAICKMVNGIHCRLLCNLNTPTRLQLQFQRTYWVLIIAKNRNANVFGDKFWGHGYAPSYDNCCVSYDNVSYVS